MTDPAWQTCVHVLLRHPEDKRVWLDADGALPRVDLPGRLFVADVRRLDAEVAARLGPAWALRQVDRVVDEAAARVDALYEMVALAPDGPGDDGPGDEGPGDHDPVGPGAPGGWRPAAELDDLAWARPGGAGALREGLRDIVLETVPPLRPAWARVEWREEAVAWIESRLIPLGRSLRGVEQVKQWGVSSVLRVDTDDGDLWFKAPNPVMPLFVNEARVTEGLSALFPDHLMAPLAVDGERDWMLLPPLEPLEETDDLDLRQEIYRRFAALQVQAVGRATELLDAGCLDRRADVLASQVGPLLGDDRALARLAPEERERLRGLGSLLEDSCGRLAAGGVPETLVHGDLHLGNAGRLDGRLVYFDWTDACVAPPFFDLQAVDDIAEEATRERLLAAYLEPWRAAFEAERVDEALRLARVLRPLHHAVSYQQIVRHLERDSKAELDATHVFLRRLLRQVAEPGS